MKKISKIVPIKPLYSASTDEAYKLFNAYKEEGVILTGNFDSNTWIVTDEYATITLDFDINKNNFQDFGDLLEIDRDEFILYLKIYVIYNFGVYSLPSFRIFLSDLKKILRCPADEIVLKTVSQADNVAKMMDFLSLLPKTGREDELEFLQNSIKNAFFLNFNDNDRNSRILASYDSYLKFSDILDDFWKNTKDISAKIYYFPLYFWWNVSGILPMRPREIALTPHDCLIFKNGEWHLRLRKNRVKGSQRKKAYKIQEDYYNYTLIIPEQLASVINWYLNNTCDYPRGKPDTLFSFGYFCEYRKNVISRDHDHFTYSNLYTVIKDFYSRIIIGEYHYQVIYDKQITHLEENQIQMIALGDTRHLAAVNAIMEGTTPTVLQVLLGDDSCEIASNYYSNADRYIECRAYRLYKRLQTGSKNYAMSVGLPHDLKEKIKVKGGWCYSPQVIAGDYEHCAQTAGPDGQIGYCPKCRYFSQQDMTFMEAADLYRTEIIQAAQDVRRIVKLYRNAKGDEGDVVCAIQRLRNKENDFSSFLLNQGGEIWEGTEKLIQTG